MAQSLSTHAPADAGTWDVIILGGGLAGLTLARQLLLDTQQRVLLLEKRAELPPPRQKVGESTVQLAGYYLSKILDLEEHLLHQHFMKYNLRFYFRSGGEERGEREGFEDYSSASIRPFSNIPSYQVDRNVLEGELLRLCLEDPRFAFVAGAAKLEVELAADGDPRAAGETPHRVTFDAGEGARRASARWLADTTGRRRLVAKKRELARPGSIRHGAFFWWVDGLVDIERLSELDRTERRRHPRRREVGHIPHWLATNHFCDHGLWFWVIPLRGKTSLGLVFDHARVDFSEVSNVEKATRFVCRRFPLFARDLPGREVVDFGGYKDFGHDCVQTLSAARWAMSGESGRFSDPLYSPGSDLIAIYNTLVVHATTLEDPEERARFCQLSESLMKAIYQAYVPGYVETYESLGDVECFTLKYVWELTIYFAFYVFPFINDLFTDRRFVVGYLRQFSRLGAWNRGVQKLLAHYTAWKAENRRPLEEPAHVDFMDISSLRRAEKTFYEVDAEPGKAKRILAEQMENLEELTRFIAVHVAAEVLGEPSAKTDRGFVRGFDLENLDFDPEAWRRALETSRAEAAGADGADDDPWCWRLDPEILDRFRTPGMKEQEGAEARDLPQVAGVAG